MNKFIIFNILILLTISNVFANEFSIKGRVLDSEGKGMPAATVALHKSTDSTVVTGDNTDPTGNFNFKAPKGNYYLKVSFLSYKTEFIENIKLNQDINLGEITLQEKDVEIDEVVVSTNRLQAELKLDKRIFNVGQDTRNRGRNASEILEGIPSVNVGVDGEVSLRGSGNVRILIDGKQSALISQGDFESLEQLQGNMIESVEVITNPSARYEAEGEVGIINIVLKKEKKFGVNGSFEANTGFPTDVGGSFNVNYRDSFYNLFGSYGLGYRERPGDSYLLQGFESQDTSFYYIRNREHVRGGLSNNFRLGSDIYITEKDIITAAVIYEYSNGNNEADLQFADYTGQNELVRRVTRTDDENELEHEFEASLNYEKQFPGKDHKLTANFKIINNDDTETSDLFENSPSFESPIIQRSQNEEDERTWFFQSDYVYPFSVDGKFETGVKIDNRIINNNFLVEQQDENQEWQAISALNNQFEYIEHIYAAYMMYGNKIGKISFQGGVRAEYTDISTELKNTGERNPRDYLDWFPSAHISYELNNMNTFQLSYSRRLTRPRFWWLLPFYGYSDNRNLFTGNPDLDPEYTNSMEIGNLYNTEKMSLLTNVYYRYRTGVMQRVMAVDSLGFTRMFPINLAEENAYGLEFNLNYDFTDTWTFNGSFNFYRAMTKGEYENEVFDIDNTIWSTNLNTKFELFNLINVQPALDYRGPQDIPQGRREAIWSFDLALSIDVLKNNGSITFASRDMFNTRRRIQETSGDGFYSELDNQWRQGNFRLSFQYRLNQDKPKPRGGGAPMDSGL